MSQVEVVDRDDAVLDYTQGVLRDLAEDILKAGMDKVGEDDKKLLLVALRDMAGTAMGRKRIKVEERAVDNAEAAAGLIAEILHSSELTAHFMRDPKDITPRAKVVLGSEVPEPTFLPGEMDVNSVQQDVDSFMKRTAHLVDTYGEDDPEEEQ